MTSVLPEQFGPEATAEPVADPALLARIEGRTPLQLAWTRFRQDRVAMGAGIVIVLIILMAVFAPLLTALIGHGPNEQFPQGVTEAGIPVGPSKEFLFGTDNVGRDVLSRVIYGSRVSILVGVVATGVALTIGITIGMFAGYLGGRVDFVLSRLMDVVLSLPFLLTAFLFVAIWRPSMWVSIIVIALFTWVNIARIVRGQVLSLREKEFVEAARSLGASDIRIMFVDVLPNLVAPLVVYATLLIPTNILFEATLSYLGIGVQIPTSTWGNMLAAATDGGIYQIAWWFMLFPGLALLVTVLAFNLLGDGLRDALDPRSARTMAK